MFVNQEQLQKIDLVGPLVARSGLLMLWNISCAAPALLFEIKLRTCLFVRPLASLFATCFKPRVEPMLYHL